MSKCDVQLVILIFSKLKSLANNPKIKSQLAEYFFFYMVYSIDKQKDWTTLFEGIQADIEYK